MTPDLIAEINAWTTGVLRARHEYEMHPFAHTGHGMRCAVLGCTSGRLLLISKRKARK